MIRRAAPGTKRDGVFTGWFCEATMRAAILDVATKQRISITQAIEKLLMIGLRVERD